MSKFITQNPAKSRRKEASRARKLAVWGDMPRSDRRKEQTAGRRELFRKASAIVRKYEAMPNVPEQPHSSYLDAIGVQELTPRQIAARKAAATRAANKAAKGV